LIGLITPNPLSKKGRYQMSSRLTDQSQYYIFLPLSDSLINVWSLNTLKRRGLHVGEKKVSPFFGLSIKQYLVTNRLFGHKTATQRKGERIDAPILNSKSLAWQGRQFSLLSPRRPLDTYSPVPSFKLMERRILCLRLFASLFVLNGQG
jgi:hypothetical protein